MRLVALVSGGKDSTYAAYLANKAGHEIVCLLSIIPPSEESHMYHYTNIHMMPTVSSAWGLPIILHHSKEDELAELEESLSLLKVDGVCTGAVASVYQKSRIENIAEKLGLETISPLWGCEPEKTLLEMVDEMDVMMVRVAADGLGKEWLGKVLDKRTAYQLIEVCRKYRIHPMGEGGEYETFVLNAPHFKKRIRVV